MNIRLASELRFEISIISSSAFRSRWFSCSRREELLIRSMLYFYIPLPDFGAQALDLDTRCLIVVVALVCSSFISLRDLSFEIKQSPARDARSPHQSLLTTSPQYAILIAD